MIYCFEYCLVMRIILRFLQLFFFARIVGEVYNELLCQHKKIHRFKVYKLYSLFVFQFIALEGVIHFIRYTVI